MLRILYVTETDPRFRSYGGEQRTNLLWQALKKYGIVYTLVIRNDLEEVAVEGEHPICFYAPNRHESGWMDLCFRYIKKLTWIPFLPFTYKLNKEISAFFPGVSFDVLVARYIANFAKYHLWKIAPSVIDVDDHPVQFFDTFKYALLPIGIRSIGKRISRIQTYYVFKKMKGGWISNQEQLRICPPSFYDLPNMTNLPSAAYNPHEEDRQYLLTIGSMGYIPNYRGIDHFLTTIWPHFHRRYPQVNYLIGGKDAPMDYAERWNAVDGVEYVGYIENLEMAYQHCLASVIPIDMGAGTCIRTLETMAYSRVCLTTRFGVRGMSADYDTLPSGMLLFQTADDFMGQFEKLLNQEWRLRAESEMSQFFGGHYSETQFIESVDQCIKMLQMLSHE